jgi:hypothetical protein
MLEKDEIDAIKEMALDLKLSEALCLKCWTLAKNPHLLHFIGVVALGLMTQPMVLDGGWN